MSQSAASYRSLCTRNANEQSRKDAIEDEKKAIREIWNAATKNTPLNVTKDIYQFAARVGKKFGVEIEFVETLDGERRGEITGNKIKIARDATQGDVVKSVIMHELMHKAEGAGKLYGKMQKMILDMKYGGDQDAMDADIAQKVADYGAYYRAKNRTDAFTEENAKEEIVADYMGEILNGNPEMIERLVRDDSTLAKRIMNTIKDAISKFAGVKDPQLEQMKKAVKLFERALKKADKVQGGTKYLLGGANIPVEQRGQDYFDNIDLHEDIRVHNVTAITVPLGNRGRIDDKAIIVGVRKNPLVSQIGSSYVAKCPDIDAKVELTDDGLMHGFHKFSESNKKNNSQPSPMALLNAKAAMHMPELLQNAVEVNRSDKYTDPKKYIGDSHVLMSVYGETDPNGNTDYYAVRMVVENRHHKHSNPLVEFGVVGKLHAGNAKKIPSANLRLPAASAVNYLGSASVSTYYKVADLINDVKGTFDDTFSKGVYQKAGMPRAQNDFSQHLKYSLPSRSALEADILAWQKAHQAEIDAAKKKGDSRSQQPDTLQRNPLPDPVKRVIDDNAIFSSYKADTNEDQFNRAMEKIEENGYAKEVKRLLDADDFSLDDSVEAGALAIAAFAWGIRLWGIEQQKCSNELTKTMSRSIIIHRGTLCPVRPLPAGFSAPSGAGI